MSAQSKADAIRQIREWRANPVKFAWDNFKFEPDPWQREFLECLPDPAVQRIALKACKGPGKTATLAVAGWNFISCYGETGDHPKGACVAISKENLKDNLWTEYSKWQQRSPYLRSAFEWTANRIFAKDHPETWYLSARAWSKSADKDQQANTLAGLHAKYLLFQLDESGGIPDSVMVAADAGLSTFAPGHWIKIMQGGNPTHLEGPLYRACTVERPLWKIIEITGDPDDPRRSSRISVQWAREQIQKYGRDNPWVLVNVFGRFPPASINALIGPDECSIAAARHFREDQYMWAPRILGVDCARFGDDETVLMMRQGLASFPPTPLRNAKTQEIGGRIIRAKTQDGGWHACFIDTAMAGGVIDYCELLHHKLTPVDFGGSARDTKMYANRRAEMAYTAAEFLKAGGGIPNDPMLIQELCAHTYTFNDHGQILLEPKDGVKEKIGRSPDRFDAYILTHAEPVTIQVLDELGKPILEETGHAVLDDGRYDSA